MTNLRVYKCYNCNHASMVKSNFRESITNKFYCKSDKKIACENERVKENEWKISDKKPKYSPVEWR